MLAWIAELVCWLLKFILKYHSENRADSGAAYKGSRPDPPSAVAVVWAEDALQDSAIKLLADIIRWCDHSKLESFLIYDPSGILKPHSAQFRSDLPEKIIQVGWQSSQPGLSIICQDCRASREGTTGSSSSITTADTSSPCSSSPDAPPSPSPSAAAAGERNLPLRSSEKPFSAPQLRADRTALPGPRCPQPLEDIAPCGGDCSPASAPADICIAAIGRDPVAPLCCARLSHDGAIAPLMAVTPGTAPAAASGAPPAAASSSSSSAAEDTAATAAMTLTATGAGAAGPAVTAGEAGEAPAASTRAAGGAEGSGRQRADWSGRCGLPSSRPCASCEAVGGLQSASKTPAGGCSGCRPGPACSAQANGHSSSSASASTPTSSQMLGAQGRAGQAAPAAPPTDPGGSCSAEGTLGGVRADPADPRLVGQRGGGALPPRPSAGADGQASESEPTGNGEGLTPCGGGRERSSGADRRCVRVHLLSAEDGYAPVLGAARTGGVCSGCGAVIPLKEGPYREGLSRLRNQMADLAGPAVLVQPELVLVVGPVLTLAGFPPLQVAASEILHLGPSRRLDRARVEAALAKFLRTEQRFGS